MYKKSPLFEGFQMNISFLMQPANMITRLNEHKHYMGI